MDRRGRKIPHPSSGHRPTAFSTLCSRTTDHPSCMPRIETDRCHRPRAMRRGWPAWLAAWIVACVVALLAPWSAARADQPEFTEFEIVHNDEGIVLNFGLRFDLPRGVEDALVKCVPLYFVAEAEVFRNRWYWRDKRGNKVSRVWRVAS